MIFSSFFGNSKIHDTKGKNDKNKKREGNTDLREKKLRKGKFKKSCKITKKNEYGKQERI